MNNTYYVYGTYIERNRYKFKNKEDAEKFIKYANKECKSSIEWIFFEESIRKEIKTDKNTLLGISDNYNNLQNIAKESYHISKPIKATSLWNRLQHYCFFFFKINKISKWCNYSNKYWSDYIPFKKGE